MFDEDNRYRTPLAMFGSYRICLFRNTDDLENANSEVMPVTIMFAYLRHTPLATN